MYPTSEALLYLEGGFVSIPQVKQFWRVSLLYICVLQVKQFCHKNYSHKLFCERKNYLLFQLAQKNFDWNTKTPSLAEYISATQSQPPSLKFLREPQRASRWLFVLTSGYVWDSDTPWRYHVTFGIAIPILPNTKRHSNAEGERILLYKCHNAELMSLWVLSKFHCKDAATSFSTWQGITTFCSCHQLIHVTRQ